MDAIDRKILAALERDGRLTVTELAAKVGLSVSPCHRRLRALETSGAIAGYRAVLDRTTLGFGLEVVVLVTMLREDNLTVADFERRVVEIDNVVEAQRLFGDPDFLLRVVCRDIADYQRLQDERLGALPGVGRFNSTLVMKDLVHDRPLLS